MRGLTFVALVLSATTLSGCIAKTALDVVTAPVKVASQAADWATTSQDEADRNRGRELRKREEALGKLERKYQKYDAKCQDGKRSACNDRADIAGEMVELRQTLPARTTDR